MKKRPATEISRRESLGRIASAALSISGLRALARPAEARAAAVDWDPRFELGLSIQLTDLGAAAERPFVAIWLENGAGEEIRTLSVWMEQQRGHQYLDEVRRWNRAYSTRRDRTNVDLVRTTSSATRRPGTHSVVWNGKNNEGAYVPQGRYFVCVEAAREHGGYTLMRKDFSFAVTPFKGEIPTEENQRIISVAVIDYRLRRMSQPVTP